jgi:hypothetical protein
MLSEIEYALTALIVLEYVLLPISLLRSKSKFPENLTLEGAFNILESSIKRKYPELPVGFTWREAMAKIRSSSQGYRNLDWGEIESTLKKYEAFRYGGSNYPEADIRSVLKLSRVLERRK